MGILSGEATLVLSFLSPFTTGVNSKMKDSKRKDNDQELIQSNPITTHLSKFFPLEVD